MNLVQRISNELFKIRTLAMFCTPEMGKVMREDGRRRKALGLPSISPMARIDKAEMVLCNSIADLDYPFAVESWVPSQHDVLAHPNVKVFFTHGGGNGFNEGVYFGKPLVVRPLWVDCFDQAVRGRDFGISLPLDRPHALSGPVISARLDIRSPFTATDKAGRGPQVLTQRSAGSRNHGAGYGISESSGTDRRHDGGLLNSNSP
ncbi:hypothetical protein [Streptomyces roseoverticillatus]|uniref:hypothetical protein n=1 Tax=Streptomyces roseoverticillatus TaxID=66429 RepID=UPI0035ABE13E